ncbi:hypothetical protein QQ020_08285 [Fulvivirgaceae bacterium BMA12]|uniref:Serine/threonine protein kinase n=1 Tax=Agaribacillus aureus TaxID=3051825 RepID=A0ABT8L6I4_9BACT|nr:hypothetical protein [Fulvivirgaceae bacterium BMA12]
MELSELKNTWLAYEKKLDRTWKLNLQLLRTTNLDKARSKIQRLTWIVGTTLAFYLLSSLFLLFFSIQHITIIHMAAAGIILTVWSLAIAIGAMQQLALINQLDYAAPVTTLQKKLEVLRLIVLKYFRLAIWILPFYMAFQIVSAEVLFGYDIIKQAKENWLIWQAGLSIAFIPLTIWLHQKLNPKNMHKSWMKKVLKGNGSQITEAIEFIREIEKFEKEA